MRRLSALALMPLAAFAVHWLRYLLAFGSGARIVLERQGHAYLHSLLPWILLAVGFAVGRFARAAGRALRGNGSARGYAVSFFALWLICAACLICLYVCQEGLEGVLAAGHPAGLAGIFGYGGWWSIPAALAVGLVVAALLHGADWVLTELSRRFHRPARPGREGRAARPWPSPSLPRLAPLAGGWSSRGPPC
jgi:hypothetical protein